eukprot:GGOE01043028.1.p1 GENE.GGOE01043028.1~~GGOE01043028.1.p1  ORF type:complete len:135 (-),score=29.56 GGOE01043028.1:321-725(-)
MMVMTTTMVVVLVVVVVVVVVVMVQRHQWHQPAAPSAHAARRANRSSHQAYFAIMRRQGQKHQTEGAHPTPEDTCEDAPSSPVVPLPLLEGSMAVVSPPRTPAMATGGWSPFEGPQWLPPRMVPTSLERPGQWA